MRAVIEADHILPSILDLISSAALPAAAEGKLPPPYGTEDEFRDDIRVRLENTDYLKRIEHLGRLGAHRQALSDLPNRMIVLGRQEGVGAGVAFIGLLYPTAAFSLRLDQLGSLLWVSAVLVFIGTAFAVARRLQGYRTEERLSEIFGNYG